MEGHWKFLGGGGGVLKYKVLEAKYEAKLEFARGGGCKTKNSPWQGGGGGGLSIFSETAHFYWKMFFLLRLFN